MEDPDVVLIGQNKDVLMIQVHFRGTSEKHSVKFDFNLEKDSVESVVNEMVHEQIISSRLETYLCTELHRIIRENTQNLRLQSNTSVVNGTVVGSIIGSGFSGGSIANSSVCANNNSINTNNSNSINTAIIATNNNNNTTANTNITNSSTSIVNGNGGDNNPSMRNSLLLNSININAISNPNANPISISNPNPPNSGSGSGFSPTSNEAITRMTFNNQSNIMADAELEKVLTSRMQGYPDDMTIADFALDIANLAGRTAEKAREWAQSLEQQDIQTVGNLRALHEEDWTKINLTVFASRLLQNAIRGIPMCLSPKTTMRNDEMDECDKSILSNEVASPTFVMHDSTIPSKPRSPDNPDIIV